MVDSNFAFIDPVSAVVYYGGGGGGSCILTMTQSVCCVSLFLKYMCNRCNKQITFSGQNNRG